MNCLMNCFFGMVDRPKAFSLISSRDHCQRSSPSRISDRPRVGFEPAQSLSSGLVPWSCAVVISTTPWRRPFSEDVWGNRSWFICVNSFNIRIEIWRRSQSWFNTITWLTWLSGDCTPSIFFASSWLHYIYTDSSSCTAGILCLQPWYCHKNSLNKWIC